VDFVSWIKELSDREVDDGDFVTLSRHNNGFITYETIQTFSDIIINRQRPTYACNAPAEWQSDPDIFESDEDYNTTIWE
jgi:hypothetical protein